MWIGAATPVPVRAAADGELEALLTNEALVEAAPLDCGVNITVKLTLWPADKVNGNVRPLIENSELPTSTEDTTTLAPVTLKVPVCDPLVPTVTSPILTVDGLTFSCPEEAPIAEPLKAMLRMGFEASDAMAMVPLTLPVDCGANMTAKEVVCPGERVRGVLIPDTLNPEPLAVTCEMVASAPPVF